jgi:hypothetical protein
MPDRGWFAKRATSLPHQLAAFTAIHLAGVLAGITLLPLRTAAGPSGRPVAAGATASSLFATNSKLVAITFLVSACSGGVAAVFIVGVNGIRYGLALAAATPAVRPTNFTDQLMAITFPWLEFVALICMATLGALLFWRLWVSARLIGPRLLAGVSLGSVACLWLAAGMEARVLGS